MGRAWILDDILEANGISMHTNNDFLKYFIEYGSTILYQKWVLEPTRTNNVSEDESDDIVYNSKNLTSILSMG